MPFLVDALVAELRSRLNRQDWRVETIFVGGGTPTFLPETLLHRLFAELGKVYSDRGTVEFTVEANPGTLTVDKANILRKYGVNRLSLGAQSFNENELRVLDRIHGPDQIQAGVEIVRQAGFEHLNLDLIFGIPGQSLESWLLSLDRAVALQPDHLSCYGLTYEPDTPLTRLRDQGGIIPVDQQLEADMYLACIDRLQSQGFEQYEISNFARPGGRCRHNLRYWNHQPGIGIGPSAASYLKGCRWQNIPDTRAYIKTVLSDGEPASDFERLSTRQHAGEVAMLRLRLAEGIEPDDFRKQTGFDLYEMFGDLIKKHTDDGLLEILAGNVRLTSKGMLLGDEVIAEFLVLGK